MAALWAGPGKSIDPLTQQPHSFVVIFPKTVQHSWTGQHCQKKSHGVPKSWEEVRRGGDPKSIEPRANHHYIWFTVVGRGHNSVGNPVGRQWHQGCVKQRIVIRIPCGFLFRWTRAVDKNKKQKKPVNQLPYLPLDYVTGIFSPIILSWSWVILAQIKVLPCSSLTSLCFHSREGGQASSNECSLMPISSVC